MSLIRRRPAALSLATLAALALAWNGLAEEVAAAAQTTVEKIMGFATPVLAERAYVAQQAQRASIRRRAGDGPLAPRWAGGAAGPRR